MTGREPTFFPGSKLTTSTCDEDRVTSLVSSWKENHTDNDEVRLNRQLRPRFPREDNNTTLQRHYSHGPLHQ